MPEQQDPPTPSTVAQVNVPQWQAHAFDQAFESLRRLFGGQPSARACAVVRRELYGESVALPPRAAG
jgi:hypothetical protein